MYIYMGDGKTTNAWFIKRLQKTDFYNAYNIAKAGKICKSTLYNKFFKSITSSIHRLFTIKQVICYMQNHVKKFQIFFIKLWQCFISDSSTKYISSYSTS